MYPESKGIRHPNQLVLKSLIMLQLLSLMGNYGGIQERMFLFASDRYGHDRVNIKCRGKFHLHREHLVLLMADDRFNQNGFITEDRIVFNDLKYEDLSAEEQRLFNHDVKLK